MKSLARWVGRVGPGAERQHAKGRESTGWHKKRSLCSGSVKVGCWDYAAVGSGRQPPAAVHPASVLYLNPPEHALVLSVDEKSQVQALDRTQPGLPLKKGRVAR